MGDADTGPVFGNQSQFLAVDLEAVIRHLAGDPPAGFRRDARNLGKTEIGVSEFLILLDEPVRLRASDAGVFYAELLPCRPELFIQASFVNLLQAECLRGRAFVGDYGERLLTPHPDAGIDPFSWCFHKKSVLRRSARKKRQVLFKTKRLAFRCRADRRESLIPYSYLDCPPRVVETGSARDGDFGVSL